jgi:hypothetical protein
VGFRTLRSHTQRRCVCDASAALKYNRRASRLNV